MQFSAAQIAMLIDGQVEGNSETTVNSFGKIEEAKAGQLAFLANPKYEDYLYTTSASIIIINETQELKQPLAATLVKVKDAYTAFATLLHKYQEFMTQQLAGIEQPSFIAPTATVGENAFVAAFVYISENAKIGKNVKIFPHVFIGANVTVDDNTILHSGVKIYQECKVGKNVIIHAGSVIGSDGFGFAPQADGTYKKVPQIGNVVIEDNVEIGANATIDRATIGSTLIKDGAKLDNLIQIAHNVEIGRSTVIAAQAGISGSTKIGNNVMIGGQAGIVGHLQIADNSKINAQSGVTKSIKTNSSRSVTGTPAHDYTSALRSQALSRNLPDMEKRIADLEKMIQQLVDERENA
ncbi:UDP-3-O-[3-hydroxymyristoyl] glucosamine N-acyltransferase [Filimonas lacunae]|uniref:UDP-3-O-acylglucosamine N-acyltransferase n=1 Tax=Filimonas lacunae TaxID=477680 RepID=A0A173MNX3_9BACT|nr:UDP-3-O-(3-hydroxymyristoyl)glucosamine N-acyltransferase [Filimonas lacunae]BAV09078.1 UDP-3-O-[3-hydroxymyristoyl] glucosamine N-acyltransferase [Filimonas lacunae]SIS66977.1 UDP-3-O-[3-hydroxymyristoyl] glucosamine N-acyltransferase [Filimonas lacunae]